jgi:hypothetical protein
MQRMATESTTKESGAAGKPGEGTAQGKTPAVNGEEKNLTPANVIALMSSEFAKPEPAEKAAAAKPGEGVQPGGGAEDDKDKAKAGEKEPEWSADQKAWFELRSKATSPEEIEAADAQAPEFTPEQRTYLEKAEAGGSEGAGAVSGAPMLPEHLEAELKAWETAGGELPPGLQKLVEKRIGKIVSEREGQKERADTAEAEVARLTGELQARGNGAPPAVGAVDEKALTGMVTAAEKFRADARAYIGGYADEEAAARIENHLEKAGMDDKGLRRQLDEVNDWLTAGAPKAREQLQEFKRTEAKIAPVVKSRFPTIEDASTPEGKHAAEIERFLPELKQRSPAHAFSKAVYALGLEVFNHMSAASAEGDVIAAVRAVLKEHVPLPGANGQAATGKKLFLPGKRPPSTAPRAGSPVNAPRGNRRDQEQEQQSATLRENPTAENMTATLAAALGR